ncbi:site-specific integrase [Actinocorallia sp. API 0066]|uniref:tyrosine-type recombinase/integrase n=1 Tax=Actinocorallia sp. API 0066 TaxID=2896846 RepID=UPI001E43FA59|nr:site-specific integrase [Actinocorallia sp. API 0066]MCD0451951.1 site-specific integrase [Actinocorallia sp. API 0066]
MSVSDRWHTSKPRRVDGEPVERCREHKQYPSATHGEGDRWQVRYRDEHGKQKARNFPRKDGKDPETCAAAFDAQRKTDTDRGDWIDPRRGRTTLAEYAPLWMKSRLHKPSTAETYGLHLRNHILPGLGKLGLAAIRPTTVQQWVKDLHEVKKLAPRTIETIYGIFASVLQGAVRDEYIRKSPCVDIRLPEVSATVVRLLTPAQVVALSGALPKRYRLLPLLGAAAGLRQGEAFGLARDRVLTDERMIKIDQQVVITNRRPVLASPKTPTSKREVPGPDFLLAAIARHVEDLTLGEGDVLCLTGRGHLLRRDYFNERVWKPAIGKVKLHADTTFHDLRHTFASTALAQGVPISEVSRWLGHRSITTTVDLYGHLVPEAGGRARTALDEAFRPALGGHVH